jgi:IS4 transposase
MRWNTINLVDQAGEPFDLVTWLQTRSSENETHEITAWARSGKHQAPIKIRLIARRKPPEVIEAEHKRMRQHASRKQHAIDPRSLIAAEYVVLATSLPEEEFPAEEVLAVYRLRWQIELAFKRLKSLLHIDKLRTKTEAGTRCWLYAHLIVALLGDDLSQDFLESFPSGPF